MILLKSADQQQRQSLASSSSLCQVNWEKSLSAPEQLTDTGQLSEKQASSRNVCYLAAVMLSLTCQWIFVLTRPSVVTGQWIYLCLKTKNVTVLPELTGWNRSPSTWDAKGVSKSLEIIHVNFKSHICENKYNIQLVLSNISSQSPQLSLSAFEGSVQTTNRFQVKNLLDSQ